MCFSTSKLLICFEIKKLSATYAVLILKIIKFVVYNPKPFMNIRHLAHHEIDFSKWNQLIDSAQNHFCYAYSWYLDAVSPLWEALILDDYQYVMPITVKKKFGFKYIVQPILSQQLGIFSANSLTDEYIRAFIAAIPYKSYAIHLNASNYIEKSVSRPNFILQLNRSYSDLYDLFSKNTKRNIDKSMKFHLSTDEQMDINSFLHFHHSIDKNFLTQNRKIVESLFKSAEKHNMLSICGVKNKENKYIAAVALIVSTQKITYLMAASNPDGKDTSAMFFLMHHILKKYTGRELVLDFEGSSVEGIARFYKSFGAVYQPFYIIQQYRPAVLSGKI